MSASADDASARRLRPLPAALRDGFAFVVRAPGLLVLLWLVNLGLAALLAVPFASRLGADLDSTGAAGRMLYGFDTSWWEAWHERQTGYERTFGPAILGVGFAFDQAARLLRGELPLRLFAGSAELAAGEAAVLALGAAYLVLQLFLAGGVLGAIRAGGSWTVRGLLHGAGFYFPRMLRIALVSLAAAGLAFAMHSPVAEWAEARAAGAVSERTAIAWLLGRHGLLLLGLALVHMVSSYAKVVTVVDERSSAVLAWASALAFCARHPLRTAGHVAILAAAGGLALAAWAAADGAWRTVGYRTQVVTLALGQLLVIVGLGLRLARLAGQVTIYRESVRASAGRIGYNNADGK